MNLSKGGINNEIHLNSIRGIVRTTYALGKLDDNKIWFKALVNTGEVNAWDWQQQGRRLFDTNQYLEAGQTYQQAAILGGHWTNWCDAAKSYSLASGQEESILLCARKCIGEGAGKKDSEGHLSFAHMQIADVLNQRGVYEEALSHAKESNVLAPEGAWSYDSQAVALIGLRRFQEAINSAKQAIRLSDGKYGQMHFRLGYAYFETENWQFAKQSYEKAAELMPTEEASAYNVALCNQRMGLYLGL